LVSDQSNPESENQEAENICDRLQTEAIEVAPTMVCRDASRRSAGSGTSYKTQPEHQNHGYYTKDGVKWSLRDDYANNNCGPVSGDKSASESVDCGYLEGRIGMVSSKIPSSENIGLKSPKRRPATLAKLLYLSSRVRHGAAKPVKESRISKGFINVPYTGVFKLRTPSPF
jgi:hypothetical protein